jgi:hypothetical protein
MAKRLFDFRCKNNHVEERFIDTQFVEVECSKCGELASRLISPVRSKLEGITGAFPTAYDRWGTVHKEAAQKARQRNRDHVDPNA